jgi:hypothetical protein
MTRLACRRAANAAPNQNHSTSCAAPVASPAFSSSCSSLEGARLPAASHNNLANAQCASLAELQSALGEFTVSQNEDGSTTLNFNTRANSYDISYTTANSRSAGSAPTIIDGIDGCGRRSVSLNTKMDGRYQVETTLVGDGNVAFKIHLDAALLRAGLRIGDRTFVIDPKQLQQEIAAQPATRPYEELSPSPSDEIEYSSPGQPPVPSTPNVSAPITETPAAATTILPEVAPEVAPEITPVAPPEPTSPSDLVAPQIDENPADQPIPLAEVSHDDNPYADQESLLSLLPERLDPVDSQPLVPANETDTSTSTAVPSLEPVGSAIAAQLKSDGSFPFSVPLANGKYLNNSYGPRYGGFNGYMHLDAQGQGKVQTLWSISDYRQKDGTWSSYPLAGFDSSGNILTSISALPTNTPSIQDVRPTQFKNEHGAGVVFPRWQADGSRGALVLQLTDQLPPSIGYVYRKAAELGREQGLNGLATMTPIEMPASEERFRGNVHGWLAPDGRVLFTHRQEDFYRVYDPMEHMSHVRERRYQNGEESGGWATLKSSWDKADGYRPTRSPIPSDVSPAQLLERLWGK